MPEPETTTQPPASKQQKALMTLIEGCKLAQSKGAFTLEQSADILAAIKQFVSAPPPPVSGK